MDFFDVVTTQRAMRRLKTDAVPDAALQRIMDAAVCAPSGGNRQNWSFVVVRDQAKRARLGELYREAWGELMKVPYYAGASKEPVDSPAGKMLASARHLAEHLGEAPVIVLACVSPDPGVTASLPTRASIYPAVQDIMLAIPADVETAALIPLGYPLGKFGRPPRRPVREVAFADRWGLAL